MLLVPFLKHANPMKSTSIHTSMLRLITTSTWRCLNGASWTYPDYIYYPAFCVHSLVVGYELKNRAILFSTNSWPAQKRNFSSQKGNSTIFEQKIKHLSRLKDELSDVLVNIATGEKLTINEYEEIAGSTILRVLQDGSRKEMTLSEAVSEAEELDLDAVLVNRESNPMVIKLLDSGKIKHELSKKQKDMVRKSQSVLTKELRLGIRIGQHDLDFKLKQAKEFFSKGHRVKLFIQLRGADFYNCQKQASDKLEEIAAMLNEASVVAPVTLLGRITSLTLAPIPKKGNPSKKSRQPSSSAADGSDPKAVSPDTASTDKANQEDSSSTA